ncbi:hypothetical protein SNARM312S_04796 [Streptomyces narbonensis]
MDSSHRAVFGPVLRTGKLCLSWYLSTSWRAVVSVRRWAEVVILSRRLVDQKVGPAFQHFFLSVEVTAWHRRSAGVSYQMRYLPGSVDVKFSGLQVRLPSA